MFGALVASSALIRSAHAQSVTAASLYDAFMLGSQMGNASFKLSRELLAGEIPAGQARETARRMANTGGRGMRLGLGAVQPLESATMQEFGKLAMRAELDEGGTRARLQAATSPQHAHLYMVGFFAGMHMYVRFNAPELDNEPLGVPIEKHAQAAGLSEALWRPLASKPVGPTPEARRDAYIMAMQRTAEALGRGEGIGAR